VQKINKDKSVKMTSLEKGLFMMKLLAEEPYKYTLSQLVEMTGMNRTTIYRTLTILIEAGMLIRDSKSKEYKMGPLPYKMGNVYLMNADFRQSILTLLEKIAEESGESVGIAHREGNKVMSIYAVEIHQPIKINDKPGTLYPMNKGCYGKCLMAYHDTEEVNKLLDTMTFLETAPNTLINKNDIIAEYKKIREQGFVTSIEEILPYMIGVGIPLKSPNGRVENVVAISFFKQENNSEKIQRMYEILIKYHDQLEKYLL